MKPYLLAAVLVAFAVSACGKKEEAAPAPAPVQAPAPVAAPADSAATPASAPVAAEAAKPADGTTPAAPPVTEEKKQ